MTLLQFWGGINPFIPPLSTPLMLVMMSTVVLMCTESFLTEVKYPNPRCAAGNARQAKIINQGKTARLVIYRTKSWA